MDSSQTSRYSFFVIDCDYEFFPFLPQYLQQSGKPDQPQAKANAKMISSWKMSSIFHSGQASCQCMGARITKKIGFSSEDLTGSSRYLSADFMFCKMSTRHSSFVGPLFNLHLLWENFLCYQGSWLLPHLGSLHHLEALFQMARRGSGSSISFRPAPGLQKESLLKEQNKGLDGCCIHSSVSPFLAISPIHSVWKIITHWMRGVMLLLRNCRAKTWQLTFRAGTGV